MNALSTKLRKYASDHNGVHREGILHWCPGCDGPHAIAIISPGRPQWTWDGNVDAPTTNPSILCFTTENGRPRTLCHYFLRAGNIEFCPDSAHALAGKTVPLPDWPADMAD